tara:strand:+ start:568 stop:1401 length:834 start_codon:yes stop_codon:yes gene_type:complete
MKITRLIKKQLKQHIKSVLSLTAMIIAVIAIMSSMTLSCVSLHSHLEYTHRKDKTPPTDAFAFVRVTKTAEAEKCLESPLQDECNQIIDSLPPIVLQGTGSGLLIATSKQPIVLTAAHVCLPSFGETHEWEGIIIKIRSTSKVEIRTVQGDILKGTIVSYDKEADLCAVSVSSVFAPPVRLADSPPKMGDRVFAISAPYGINAPTMSLIFTGFYSGVDEDIHFYTIPTRPGSSGSVVLNSNYRAIGMLNGAFRNIENIGIGPGHAELKKFIPEIWDQ